MSKTNKYVKLNDSNVNHSGKKSRKGYDIGNYRSKKRIKICKLADRDLISELEKLEEI